MLETVTWHASLAEDAMIGERSLIRQPSLLVSFNKYQPLFFRRLSGRLSDIEMALNGFTDFEAYGREQKKIVVFGSDFYSEEKLSTAVRKGAKAVFVLSLETALVRESIGALKSFSRKSATEEESPVYLKEEGIQVFTIKRMLKADGKSVEIYIHVFRSTREIARVKEEFYEQLGAFEELWAASKGDSRPLVKEGIRASLGW